MFLTDGYKLDHRRQYPNGTEYVYSTWIPRGNHYLPEAKGAVVFGVQYMIKQVFKELFNREFFDRNKEEVCSEFTDVINEYLGENNVGVDHIAKLHDLGYLPIRVKSLPEGSICPIGVPAFTIINTLPEFFWITNFLETIISNVIWLPMTSATVANVYKQELIRHSKKTGFYDESLITFLCHDFSMRGMSGIEASIISGMGHLLSFIGSESIPAIIGVKEHYGCKSQIASTIFATEHSVMCAGGCDDELGTFRRLITEIYPEGLVSIVSDTWDFWKVMTEYLPILKDQILARDGRVVIRPDSGCPEDIICGLPKGCELDSSSNAEIKGAYEILWDIFGGTINEAGYKVLNPKIGLIYGDSITIERQKDIYKRLEEKGFASTNLVLGIGSYSYQYRTRDSLGFAMKSTWCQINGESREIFKKPKTDDGTKNSLKGLCTVRMNDDNSAYKVIDQCSHEDEAKGELQTVFENGVLKIETTFDEIRERLCKQ